MAIVVEHGGRTRETERIICMTKSTLSRHTQSCLSLVPASTSLPSPPKALQGHITLLRMWGTSPHGLPWETCMIIACQLSLLAISPGSHRPWPRCMDMDRYQPSPRQRATQMQVQTRPNPENTTHGYFSSTTITAS